MAEKSQPQLKCELLDSFAIIVQGFMAMAAASSLFYKRHRERPKRPLVIWALDTSKQAISASMIHFANILISYITGSHAKVENACVHYFLNILLDTTVGVGILYVFLNAVHSAARHYGITEIESGVYGTPPRFSAWFKQLLLFLFAWFGVKLVVVIALIALPFLATLAELLLLPLQYTGDTRLQVVFVMMLFPLIMNIVQAWLIDMVR